jgi:hypothetical protein
MRKHLVSWVAIAVLISAGSARAQDMPEPTEDPSKTPPGPGATPIKDEPEEPMLPGEKPGDADKPGNPDDDDLPAVLIEEPNKAYYGIGVRARGVTTPSFMLDLFFDHHTGTINSAGFGLELIRRKRNLDIVLSVERASHNGKNGVWLDAGSDPGTADWVEFENFAFLSTDVSFIWHRPFSKFFALRYGAGLGVGFINGEMIRQDASGCTSSNLADPSGCRPAGANCDANGCTASSVKSVRSTNNPKINDGVPPVLPTINVLFGGRISISPHFTINLETGFHDFAFFGGVGTDYLF